MALSTFESRKSNAKFDKLVHTGHHENPTSKMFTEISNKLDELVAKINSIDTATNANTAKTSMTLGTSGSTALAGDTNIVTIGSSTTIAFGDMVTVPGKGKLPATYNIVMTVTNGGVSKSTTLTLT